MFSRKDIEGIWKKYFSNRDGGNKPLLLNGPFSAFGRGTLWGGSIELFVFEHQSFSRSGSSFITIACFPTDGDPLFVVSHAHHEGTESEVISIEQLKRNLERYGKDIADGVACFEADPKFGTRKDIIHTWRNEADTIRDALLLYGVVLTTLEICENYIGPEEGDRVVYPAAPDELASKL